MSDNAEVVVKENVTTPGLLDPSESHGKGAPIPPADTGKGPKPVSTEDAAKVAAEAAKAKEKETPEAAKVEDTQDNKDWHKQYVKMDDPHAQAAIDMLSAAGVSPIEANAAFADAIDKRDLNLIKWDLLETKLGKPQTLLVKAGVESAFKSLQDGAFATEKMVYSSVGGEANWTVMRAWFQKQEAAGSEVGRTVPELRKMLDAGGTQAKLAISEMKRAFESDKNNKGLKVDTLVTGDKPTVTDSSALSKADYLKLINEAHKMRKSDSEINAIRARRLAGMKQGI